jgi:hypothetical protein
MGTKITPVQYDEAKEVAKLAKFLIPKHHPNLATASIGYLFKNKTVLKGGKAVVASIKRCDAMLKHLTSYDYIMTVSYSSWNNLTDKQKVAVTDHELSHCQVEEDEETGELSYKLISHDFEDFYAILDRHGLYMDDLKDLKKVAKK